MTFFCSHDAGGSNHILYMYLKQGAKTSDDVFVTGPGIEIAKQLGVMAINQITDETYEKHDLFFVGSSDPQPVKMHDIVIVEAKRRFKRVIGVLDNWENFEKRWPLELPDEIWTTDKYAFEIASRVFNNQEIKLVRNAYLENLKEKLKGIERLHGSVLFLNSPNVRTGSQTLSIASVCVCELLFYIKDIHDDKEIIVRNHPKQNKDVCTLHKRNFGRKDRIYLSTNPFLYQDLAKASIVIGFPNYALFAAKELGFEVKSIGQFKQLGAPEFTQLSLPVAL